MLLDAAKALGAEVLPKTPVKWLAEEHGRVVGVMTDDGVIHADETVVAAGAQTAQLLDFLLQLDQVLLLFLKERVELQPVSGVSFLFLIVQVIHLNQSAGDRIHKAASTICCS